MNFKAVYQAYILKYCSKGRLSVALSPYKIPKQAEGEPHTIQQALVGTRPPYLVYVKDQWVVTKQPIITHSFLASSTKVSKTKAAAKAKDRACQNDMSKFLTTSYILCSKKKRSRGNKEKNRETTSGGTTSSSHEGRSRQVLPVL